MAVAQIAATLNNVPTPLAVAAAGFIGALGYELGTFCNSDPPPMPTITASDWVNLITTLDPVAHFAAVVKFEDLLGNIYWPSFCQCTGGGTPPPPALPAPPAGLPNYQPPQLPGPTAPPCFDQQLTSPVLGSVSRTQVLPVYVQGAPIGFRNVNAGAGPTQVQFTETVNCISGPCSSSYGLQLYWYDTSGTEHLVSGGPGITNPPATKTSPVLTIPAGAVGWYLVDNGQSTAEQYQYVVEAKAWCNGSTPTLPSAPCCPPDPSVVAMLQSIYALVESMYNATPTPLRSYAESTVHSGLSGSGSFTLGASTIGLKVALTTIPPNVGQATGDPVFFFDAGYLTWIAAEAPYGPGQRIVFNPQLFALPALVERVGYTLPPGLVVSITELTAGP